MKDIWIKHKTKIIAVVYVLVFCLVFYLAIIPMAQKIIATSDEMQEKILSRDIENSRISQLAKMEEEEKSLEDNGNVLAVILARDEAVDFIKKMENIAQETGNDISFHVDEGTGVKAPTASNKKKDVSEKTIKEALSYTNYVTIQIDLMGSYDSFATFLKKLENTHNYINVLSLESKVEPVQADESATKNNSSSNIFSPTEQQKEPEKKEKNILHSTINVVLYTKK